MKLRRMYTDDGRTALVNVGGKRLYGDPRTTGRQETASQRRKRRRAESRGHAPRRNPIGQHAASSHDVEDVPINEALDPRDGQCNGTTKLGRRCKRKTEGLYCPTHEPKDKA